MFAYGHIQGVGVTAYCIYNNVHIVKLKRWGQNVPINEVAGKNSLNNIVTMSVKYINLGKILYPSGHLEA